MALALRLVHGCMVLTLLYSAASRACSPRGCALAHTHRVTEEHCQEQSNPTAIYHGRQCLLLQLTSHAAVSKLHEAHGMHGRPRQCMLRVPSTQAPAAVPVEPPAVPAASRCMMHPLWPRLEATCHGRDCCLTELAASHLLNMMLAAGWLLGAFSSRPGHPNITQCVLTCTQ